RRDLIAKVEELKAERNKHSKTKPDPKIIAQMKKLGEEIKDLEDKLNLVESNFNEKLAELPNIPADDVVAGNKENNQVIYTFGKKPEFNFTPKDHVELATTLGLIDYERAVKMSGSGFWAYTGDGALLEWALLNYFIEFHRKNNYTFVIPPYLLTEQSAFTSGHLPKFRDDLYWNQDNLCLNATSEMMMGNFHRDEILDEKKLPLKYFSYSACFRREAGSYRAEERGMVRGHQFNKIEMFQFTKPEDSWIAFEEMKRNAEKLVEGLGLHFQTSLLAAGDSSAAMAKTVDIEIWIPSMNVYKEVSSASNALDYQARRGSIRFKNPETGKNEFVHTLNASGLATSRLIPAILEQNQQADGSVIVPEVLQAFVGKKVLSINE
ncbi:MAG: serine--tRNA ligase, partial [Candidatus Komeilibacteria bacterium]|nr:serine--tRNA ligase [Candidatus Komeilibacteria bacterium]